MTDFKGGPYMIKALIRQLRIEEEGAEEEVLNNWNLAINLGLPASDEATAHVFKGSILKRKKLLFEAKSETKLGLEIDKKNTKKLSYATFTLGYIDLAEILDETGYPEDAVQLLKELIDILPIRYTPDEMPENPLVSIYIELARILVMKFRNEEGANQAEFYLQKIIEANPVSPNPYLYYAILYDSKNKFKQHYSPAKAIPYYEKYLLRSDAKTTVLDDETREWRGLVEKRLGVIRPKYSERDNNTERNQGLEKN